MCCHTNKYVIYTAISGGYDTILQPVCCAPLFDYIIFSDTDLNIDTGVWRVEKVENGFNDPVLFCRYIKTHPELYVGGYLFSIWMDANIQITSEYIYSKSLSLYQSGSLIACATHQYRQCIYEECFSVIDMMVEHERNVAKWLHVLRQERYPRNRGLNETGILYRRHDSLIKNFDSSWWSTIRHYSRRDQLSFNYWLYKKNIHCDNIFPTGIYIRNSEYVSLRRHHSPMKNRVNIASYEAWIMRYYWRCPEKKDLVFGLYYHVAVLPGTALVYLFLGQIIRVYTKVVKRLGKAMNKIV